MLIKNLCWRADLAASFAAWTSSTLCRQHARQRASLRPLLPLPLEENCPNRTYRVLRGVDFFCPSCGSPPPLELLTFFLAFRIACFAPCSLVIVKPTPPPLVSFLDKWGPEGIGHFAGIVCFSYRIL